MHFKNCMFIFTIFKWSSFWSVKKKNETFKIGNIWITTIMPPRHHLLSVSVCENRHRCITNAQVTNTKFVNFIKGRSWFSLCNSQVFTNDINMLGFQKSESDIGLVHSTSFFSSTYPNITAFHTMILFSDGAPLTPAGGSS